MSLAIIDWTGLLTDPCLYSLILPAVLAFAIAGHRPAEKKEPE